MSANNFDTGMNDCYGGKEPNKNATLEYLRGYSYAESILYPEKPPEPEQEYPYPEQEQFEKSYKKKNEKGK